MIEEAQPADNILFAQGGKSLLTCTEESVQLYQLDGTSERLNLPGRPASVPCVAFSPDGSRIASVAKDRTLTVAEADTGRELWSSDQLPGQGQSVGYSPDGRLLVTADFETQLVWLWDSQTGHRLLELGTNRPGLTWAPPQFSSDGRYLTAANQVGGIKIWSIDIPKGELAEGSITAKFFKAISGRALSPLFSPDGRHMAFVSYPTGDGFGLFSLDFNQEENPRRLAETIAGNPPLEAFAWDGPNVVFVNAAREIVTLDAATGNKVASFPTLPPIKRKGTTGFQCIALSRDGTKLAVSSPSNLGIDIFDRKRGLLLYSLPDQNGTVYWLAWSPDSQRLAVSRSNGDMSIWNLKEAETILTKLGLNP